MTYSSHSRIAWLDFEGYPYILYHTSNFVQMHLWTRSTVYGCLGYLAYRYQLCALECPDTHDVCDRGIYIPNTEARLYSHTTNAHNHHNYNKNCVHKI